jgi:hypothetical protein
MSRFPKYAKAFSRNTELEGGDGDRPRGKNSQARDSMDVSLPKPLIVSAACFHCRIDPRRGVAQVHRHHF